MKSKKPSDNIVNLEPAKGKPQKDELTVCHLADIHLGYRRYNRLSKNGQNQRELDVNLAFHEAITSGAKTKLSDPFMGGLQRIMQRPLLSSISKVDDNISSNHLTK